MTILDRIIEHKRGEVAERKRRAPLSALIDVERYRRATVSFRDALARDDRFHFICEIKKASPSKGIIRHDFDPVRQARSYHDGGASAISVLTDEKFFMGSLDHLSAVRETVRLPILRKDFIIDPYQIHEARTAGADMILLIARVLTSSQIDEYAALARGLGMDVLLELADESDIDKLPSCDTIIVGINNRDLATFAVDINRSVSLRRLLPADALVIGESGITGSDDCRLLKANGIRGALVGKTFMRSSDPAALLRRIIDEVNDEDAS
ncbi:MAG TPA: indole-3-glycerol phosphate synthase TrpC [Spirochaetota bacterium]|mgnify:FL=1|nr:indole-3-glycerol phosphate synthase TrpC [Spirochaetota bacterium]